MCHMCRRRSPRQTTPNVPPISAPPPHPTVTSQPQPRLRYCQYSRNRFSCKCSDPGSHLRLVTTPRACSVPSRDFDRSLKHSLFRKDALDTSCTVPFETFQYKNMPLLPSATLARASPRAAGQRASVAEGSRVVRKRRRGQQGHSLHYMLIF